MSAPVAAAIGFAGVAVGVGALVVLHLLPTGLSPVADAVSRYGISNFRSGYRVQTLAYATAGAAVGIGFAIALRRSAFVVALCLLFAASRAVISWIPMDEPGTTLTRTGRRHGLLALVAFLAIAVSAARLPAVLHRNDLDPGPAIASAALGWLMVAALGSMILSRHTRVFAGRFGLVERVFYLLVTAWLVLAAALVS